MCGRFTLTIDPDELRQALPWLQIPDPLAPRYNIAPSQPVAVVRNDGKNQLDHVIWGLVPSWTKDISKVKAMINARSETVLEKPFFRSAFRYRRCLILADGFYEWLQIPDSKSKTPFYIRLQSGAPFAMAGLWESWNAPDGSHLLTCAILTTQPNALMQSIHNRMPVILPASAYQTWLQPGDAPLAELQALLKPFPAEQMEAWPVSRLVNSPANNVPECVAPALST